jgi:glutamyl-tRNA synthetase
MVRVRFAPSPTGALHIGGVRTALYNYLFARQQGGAFILRIEDTDRTRFVAGAEEYIIRALAWCGMVPDEGVGFGGAYGPYRQSDRKEIYAAHVQMLLDSGSAYYAFDTPDELDAWRKETPNAMYGVSTRMGLRNSLSMPANEVQDLLVAGVPYVVRLKVPDSGDVVFGDMVRGEVRFQCKEVDDKVLFKSDGMPTYHLANVVDDHLMEITHVIRGEEWLSSTPLHILLYRAFGWEATMPTFCHLPLILRPDGKGKLSKRDGAKFGIPVYPIDWDEAHSDIKGFNGAGFLPQAVVNFLALLGWSDGTDQEIYTLAELIKVFDLTRINKSGARYDYDKALWFNHKYLGMQAAEAIAQELLPLATARGIVTNVSYLTSVVLLMRERAHTLHDFLDKAAYFFEAPASYDNEKTIRAKWSPALKEALMPLLDRVGIWQPFTAENLEVCIKTFCEAYALKLGDVLPCLRLGLSGTTGGPTVFEIMATLGTQTSLNRLRYAFEEGFDKVVGGK